MRTQCVPGPLPAFGRGLGTRLHICMRIIEFIIVIVRLLATLIIVFIVTLCTIVPEPSQDSSRSVMHRMYSVAQKKKVAEYARFHGARAAARHFGNSQKMSRTLAARTSGW